MIYEIISPSGEVENTISADAEFVASAYPSGNYRAVVIDAPIQPEVYAVSMKQARLALLAVGLLDDIDALIKASPREAQIEWEYATFVERGHPLIAAMQSAKGLSDADVDALFIAASEM